MPDFNPLSVDAMVATLVAGQKAEAKLAETYRTQMVEAVARIEKRGDCLQESVDLTNGRVTKLEHEQWKQRGFVAGIAFAVGLITRWLWK